MRKIKLHSTAALIMLWAKAYYKEDPAVKFIKHLDLSEGQRLLDLCNTICDWYGEIIANRKYFIYHTMSEKLKNVNSPWQIVILASGMCPLSLNLLAKNDKKIKKIFEIDEFGMEEKENIYKNFFPEYARKIKCIPTSIYEKRLMDLLTDSGYRKELQTIIFAEGISYYIRKRRLKEVFQSFATERNIVVLEYLVPRNNISNENRKISEKIFNIIKKECGLARIFRYTQSELKGIFIQNGGSFLRHETMSGMELLRTGSNQFFNRQNEGWIECVIGRL